MLVLIIDKQGDYDLPDIHGPFETIEEGQAYARAWREQNDIPGHENDLPTEEENEAWTEAGWFFGIVAVQNEVAEV